MVAAAIIVACAISIQTTIALGIVLAPGGEQLCSILVGSVLLTLPLTAFWIVPAPGVARRLGIVAACAMTMPPMTVSKIAPVWGGNAVEDVCGTCDDDPTNDCVLTDCADTLGGSAVLDDCGVCDEDDSMTTPYQQDCVGTWGGAATTTAAPVMMIQPTAARLRRHLGWKRHDKQRRGLWLLDTRNHARLLASGFASHITPE